MSGRIFRLVPHFARSRPTSAARVASQELGAKADSSKERAPKIDLSEGDRFCPNEVKQIIKGRYSNYLPDVSASEVKSIVTLAKKLYSGKGNKLTHVQAIENAIVTVPEERGGRHFDRTNDSLNDFSG